MLAVLGRMLAPYALKILGWVAVLGAVAAVLLGAKQAGRNAERVAQMKSNLEIKDDQLKAANRRPDDGELDRVLRDGDF